MIEVHPGVFSSHVEARSIEYARMVDETRQSQHEASERLVVSDYEIQLANIALQETIIYSRKQRNIKLFKEIFRSE